MIIPYGHETRRVQGLPWITIGIVVACLAVFLLTSGASNRSARQAEEAFSEIAETYLAQPGLALDPQTEGLLLRRLGVDENQRDVFFESLAAAAAAAGRRQATTQEEFDELTARFWAAYRASPQYRFGVVPVELSAVSLLTYQFLHGGWAHLFGNLLFLYLAAPHVEDRWGRPVFLGFYLSAGAVAALFWAFRYPDLNLPLVGASGSIAGVMGAFLICFGTSKIRFFYWFFIIWGTFEAPAWLMLPLWLVMEVVSGRTMDVMSGGDGGGGVAHWAHVWGFIFGMAIAFLMGMFGVDRRLAAKTGAAAADSDGPEPIVLDPAPSGGFGAGEPDTPLVDRLEMEAASSPSARLLPPERIRLVEVVPRSLEGRYLGFDVGQRGRRLDLNLVEAVAVGAVAGEGERRFLIVDLLLDPPSAETTDLRILRFRSTSFDPRDLVGGDHAMTAFLSLVDALLTGSGAVALPDQATVRAPSTRSYGSIEDYERRVLRIGAESS